MKAIKGRFFRPFLYSQVLLLPAVGLCDTGRQLGFSFDSINFSEATSLHSISGHWSEGISAGNEAWSFSRLTLGYQDRSFVFQTLYRDDTYYQFANDTAQLIYLAENHLPLEKGHVYPLYIKPNKISSKGFRFGFKTGITAGFELSGFISLLKPTNLLQGSLSGSATAIESNDYDFNFSSDLVYEQDPLYERARENVSGDGYSVDLSVDYRFNQNWQLSLGLLDIAGELTINNAPATTAEATSEIKVYDEDGYVVYDPVISGQEDYRTVVHRFDMQTHLSLSYQLPNQNSLVLQHHSMMGLEYQRLIFVQKFNRNQLSWQLIPKLKAVGFSFKHPNFSIGMETDNLDHKKMKFLSVNTQLFWSF